MGVALKYLSENVLSVEYLSKYFSFKMGICYPVIHFLSVTHSHDDFHIILEKIKKNPFFKTAQKFATYFNEQYDRDMLTEILSSDEAIIDKKFCIYEKIFNQISCEIGLNALAKIKNSYIGDYEYVTLEDIGDYEDISPCKKLVTDGLKIYQCQLWRCSPEKAMQTVFELSVDKEWYGLTEKKMVKVKKYSDIKMKVHYCIKQHEIRKFLINVVQKMEWENVYLQHLKIQINDDNIVIFNGSDEDIFICATNNFSTTLLKEQDYICDMKGNVLLKVKKVEKNSLDEEWEDEWW